MHINIVDTLGGTPFNDWVPKPNFHGPTFTYFDPALDGIQISFDTQGGHTYSLPLVPTQYRAHACSVSRMVVLSTSVRIWKFFSPWLAIFQ
jgi:hypothetical protein